MTSRHHRRQTARTVRARVEAMQLNSTTGSSARSIELSERLPVRFIQTPSEGLFHVPPSGRDTLFGFGDLSDAMNAFGAQTGQSSVDARGMTIEGTRPIFDTIAWMASELAAAPVAVSAASELDPDSGAAELVITVEWPAASENDLIAWNDQLMARIASEIPPDERQFITVVPSVADADQPQ